MKKTKEGYTLWPIEYMSKEEMAAKLNDPEQRDKAEYSTAKEQHILNKKEETTSAKAANKHTDIKKKTL